MPGEKLFADETIDSRSANPRLVFVLEFPQSTMLQAGRHSPNQAKATRRSSLWVHASKSATSIRKAFSRLSIRPRTQRGSGDAEVVNSSSFSVSSLSPSDTLIGNSKEDKGLKAATENIGWTSPQDPPLSPLPPTLSKTPRGPSSSSKATIKNLDCASPQDVPSSPLPPTASKTAFGPSLSDNFGSASLQAQCAPPTPKFMAPQPSVVALVTKRTSAIIRGRDLPFPVLPIGPQRHLSLPAVSIAEGYPEFGKRIASRGSSYPPSQASRPPSPQLTTEAATDSDSFRGRTTTRKPLFAPSPPFIGCNPSAHSESTNSDVPLTQTYRNTTLLRVPPFPLPHRASHSRELPLAPLSLTTCPSEGVQEPCNRNLLILANKRVGSEGVSKRRPTHLHLVNDNTRV